MALLDEEVGWEGGGLRLLVLTEFKDQLPESLRSADCWPRGGECPFTDGGLETPVMLASDGKV